MKLRTIIHVQAKLRSLGLYAGAVDGINGPRTKAAVRAFQRINGLRVDGIAGPRTQARLFEPAMPQRDRDPLLPKPWRGPANDWPRQSAAASFYGRHGKRQMKISLPYTMRIAWNMSQRIDSMTCHERVALPMTRIFTQTLAHYGEDKVRELGLDLFGGCLNVRQMRGGNRWSMHAWGIAVDIDPARNQLHWGRDRAELAKPVYEPFWRIVEAQGAVSLGRLKNFDWMHFQFARL